MSDTISFRFESKLYASTERVWEWITSIRGISAEMWPFFRMTVPKGIVSLNDVDMKLGVRMFRSYVFLFGVLPIDYSDMTLLELNIGEGFIEQSPMRSMKLWRHERRIVPCPSDSNAVLLVDQLTFQPRMAWQLVKWLIHRVFVHRHQVLKADPDGAQPCSSGDSSRRAKPTGTSGTA